LSETRIPVDVTDLAPLEEHGPARASRSGLSLFWRTFFLIALLLLGSIAAWLQALRSLEFEPRAIQLAHEIASQVNLSRAALIHADAIGRVSLLKTMADEEGLHIIPREPSDVWVPAQADSLLADMTGEIRQHLGQRTVVASQVNARSGLWVSFDIDGDDYWFQTDLERFTPARGTTWLIWLGVATVLSLSGAALIARRINRPLKQLSFAASRVRDGDFNASRLDETVHTSEIREVNIGFNRMAQRLAKLDQDRAVMLAGISHDLRTPLARLRLETEMSVSDPQARSHMAADIAQLDAIIDKFLDYARPDSAPLDVVRLGDVVQACIYSLQKQADVQVQVKLEPDLLVLADEVELGRIISNLLENARKYGKSPDTGVAQIDIMAVAREQWVLIKIRDRGVGVSDEHLNNLTKPFYRGEAARTAANGAGLGLAIVDKAVARMGGMFALRNSSSGGLSANIRLQRAQRPG
jgi:two-component system, OmpR family, osmolarity sensor histidine kinase EnvZ